MTDSVLGPTSAEIHNPPRNAQQSSQLRLKPTKALRMMLLTDMLEQNFAFLKAVPVALAIVQYGAERSKEYVKDM